MRSGIASIREIATAFLASDENQLEYYEQITKRMAVVQRGRHSRGRPSFRA